MNSFKLDNETTLHKYTESDDNCIRMRDEVEMTPESERNMQDKGCTLVCKVYVQVKADLDEIANIIPNLPIDMEATESCDGIAVLSEDMITLLHDPITVDMIQGVTTPEELACMLWSFNPNTWSHEVMWKEDGSEQPLLNMKWDVLYQIQWK